MPFHQRRTHWLAALALIISFGAAPAHAAAQKKTVRHVARLKVQQAPSQETPAQRDRRLERECKGRPNAGACLGYAS